MFIIHTMCYNTARVYAGIGILSDSCNFITALRAYVLLIRRVHIVAQVRSDGHYR